MTEQNKKTEIIFADPDNPPGEQIARAAGILLSGGIIGFPTETVYGLGADAENPEALKLLYAVKGRDMKQPTSILISRKEDLGLFASEISREAEALSENFWPGPLTIIFRASPGVSGILTAGTGTIAIRMPGSRLCLALIEKAGAAVTAPSANPRGEPPAETADEVMNYFRGKIDLVIDGGRSPQKIPSTIVDATGNDISVIREGLIPAEDVKRLFKKITMRGDNLRMGKQKFMRVKIRPGDAGTALSGRRLS